MANNRVEYVLGFKADTSSASKAISDLNAQLNKLQNLSSENLHISGDIKEAADAAKILQQNLQAATNVKTGQVNVAEFAKNLKAAGTSVTELGQKLINAGATGTQAFAQLGQSIAAMQVPLKQTSALLTNMMTTLKNTVKWEISSNLVHGIESTFSNAINYAKDLNESLTDIRIVSGQSVDQMAKFAKEANTAAKALGTTTKAYADASLIYYQQGDSAALAAKKAEITLKATNAAFKATASEMSEMLTATWNAYRAGSGELEKYVDVMANLGAHTATSMEEIATALQKVAATANNVGVGMQQMSAMIATVSSTTRQSAESIGTSMNTILSRIGGLKLGQTLEDGVDLNKYSKGLQSVGVNVLDATGNLRDMGVVIDELGSKWGTLSRAQQAATAQLIGGARNYTSMMALFGNWDKYQENLGLANNSEGALQKMQETYLTGWEGASKRLKASMEGIWNSLIDDQKMIKFTNSLSAIVDQANNLIQTFGGLPGILTQVGSIAAQVFSKNIAGGITQAIDRIKTFAGSFRNLGLVDDKKSFSELGFKDKLKYSAQAMSMTTNERLYKQTADQTYDLLKDARGQNTDNPALSAQINSSQILIEKKLELQSIESQLSDTQKAQYQAALAGLSAQAEEIKVVSAEYKEQQNILDEQTRTIRSNKELQEATGRAQSLAIKELAGKSPKEIREGFNETASYLMNRDNSNLTGGFLKEFDLDKLLASGNALDQLIERFEHLTRIDTELSRLSVSAGNGLTEAIQKPTEKLPDFITQLEQARENIRKIGGDDAANKFDPIIESLKKVKDGTEEDIVQALQNAKAELDSFGNEVSMSIGTATDILANRLGISREKLDELAESAGLTEVQLIKLAQAANGFENGAKTLEMKVSSLQKHLSNITSAAGAMAGAFSSAYNVWANWDTANIASKITGTVSAITQGINATMQGAKMGSAFGPWGTLIGGAIGLGSSIVGLISGQKEYSQKQLEQDYEDKSKQYEKIKSNNEEKQSLTELIKEYNQLYAQYKNGENVQDQLKISAEKLIEAYDLQQGKIRVLSGDYEGFNSILRNTIDLQEEINQNTQIGQAAESTLRAGVKKDNKTSAEDFTNYQSNNVQSTTDTTWASARLMTLGINLGELQEYDQSLFLSILYNELVNNLQDSFRNYFNGFDGNDVQFEFSRNKSGQISINTNRFDDIFQTIINLFGEDVYNELMNNIANNNGISGDIIGKTFSESKFASELNKQIQQYINNNGESFYNILQSLIGADDTTIESVGNFLETIFNFISSDQLEDFTSQLNELIASVYENAPDDKNYANLASALSGFDSQITGQKDWTQRALDLGILTKNDEGIIEETDLTKLSGIDLANVIKGYQTLYQELSTAESGIIEQKRAAAIKENETYDENQDSDIINLRNLKKGIAPFATEEYQQLADQVIASTLRKRQLEQMKGVAKQYSGKQLSYDDNVKNRVSISELYNTYSQNKQNVKNNQTDFQLTKASPEELEVAANKYAAESFEEVTAFGSIAEFFESFDNILDDGQMNELIAYMDSHKITDVESIQKYSQFVLAALQAGQSLEEAGGIFKTGSASIDKLEAATESQNKYETLSALEKSYKGAGKTDAAGYQALINGYQEAGIDFSMQQFEQRGEAYLAELTENARSQAESAWQAVKESSELALSTIPAEEEGLRASVQANIDTAQDWINAYRLAGNQAEDTAKKISLLQSSFSSLPTSAADMDDLLKLINESLSENEQQMTASGFMGLKKSEQQNYIIQALEQQMNGLKEGTEKDLLSNYIQTLRDQLKETKLNESLQQASAGAELLNEKLSLLSTIDFNNLEVGSTAFKELAQMMGKSEEELSSWLETASEIDLIEKKYEMLNDILSQQRSFIQQQVNLFESEQNMSSIYGTSAFNALTDEELENINKASAGDADQHWYIIKQAYAQYMELRQKLVQKDNEIMENELSKIKEITDIYEQASSTLEKRVSSVNEEAQKMQEQIEILANAAKTGYLTNAQAQKLNPDILAQWKELSSAEERANYVMQLYNQQLITMYDITEDGENAVSKFVKTLDELEKKLNDTLTNLGDEGNKIFDPKKLDFEDYVKKLQGLSDEAKGEMLKVYEDLKNKGALTGKETLSQILTAIKNALPQWESDHIATFEAISAAGLDILGGMWGEITDASAEAARKAVEQWKAAFEEIASYRNALASGKDIFSGIGSDAEKAMQVYRNSNYTDPEKFLEDWKNGKLSPDDYTLPPVPLEDMITVAGLGNGALFNGQFDIGRLYAQQKANNPNKTEAEIQDMVRDQVETALQNAGAINAKDIAAGLFNNGESGGIFNAENLMAATNALNENNWALKTYQGYEIGAQQVEMQAQIEQYKAERDALIAQANENIATYQNTYDQQDSYANAARALQSAGGQTDAEVLAGLNMSPEQFIKAVVEAGYAGQGQLSYDQDSMQIIGLNDENIAEFAQKFEAARREAQGNIAEEEQNKVQAAQDYQTKLTGHGEGQLGLGENNANVEEAQQQLNELQKTAQNASNAVQNLNNKDAVKTMEQLAKSAGVTVEELKEFTQSLKDSGEMSEDAGEKADEYAAGILRMQKGFTDAQNSMKNYQKELGKVIKDSQNEAKVLKQMKAIYGDTFNLGERALKRLSNEFVRSAKNADLLEKAAEGNEEAFDQLQAAIAADLFKGFESGCNMAQSELNNLFNMVAQLNLQDIEIGATIDDADFLAKLDEMRFTTYEAAQAMQEALSAIGVDAEIEEREVGEEDYQRIVESSGQIVTPFGDGFEIKDVTATATQTAAGGKHKIYLLKNPKNNGRGTTRGGSGQKSGGGGGGSGGGQPEKRKPQFKKEKDSDRYHQINRVLEKQKDLLEQIDKIKESKYGGAYRDMLAAENRELQKQIEYGDQKLEQAKAYLEYDKNNLLKYGATFDAQGNLNYAEYEKLWFDKWNANESAWASFAIDDDAKEEFQELFEDAMEAVKKYEDSENNIMEIEQQRLENINKMSENNLERITNDVEIHVKINQMDLDRYDYFIKKWQKSLSLQDESFDVIVNKILKYKDNLDKITDPQNGSLKQLEDMHNAYLNGDYVNGVNDAKFAEGLEDLEGQIMDYMNSILDAMDELEEVIPNAIDMAVEQMDRFTGAIDHNIGVMEHYLKILDLTGQAKDYEKRGQLLQSQYDQQLTEIAMLRNSYEMLEAQRKEYEQALEIDPDNQVIKKALERLEDQVQETEENLLSMTEDNLETAHEIFENTIDQIMDDLDRLAGVGDKGFEELKKSYDEWQKDQELYVDKVTQAYSINKLTRQMELDMANSRDKNFVAAAKALEEQINSENASKRLTEARIKDLEYEYELLKAKQALEMAEDAKDTVRLTRDENGNYIYRYTADEDELAEKQQKINDIIYEKNQNLAEEQQRLYQLQLDATANYFEELRALSELNIEDEEEFYRQKEEITNRYMERVRLISGEIQTNTQYLQDSLVLATDAYSQDVTDSSDRLQGQINSDMQAMANKAEELIDAIQNKIMPEFDEALETLKSQTDEVTIAAGTDWETMGVKIATAGEQAAAAEKKYQKIVDTLNDTLTPLEEQAEAWSNLNDKLAKALGYYEEIHERVANVYSELNNTHADINSLPDVHIPVVIYDEPEDSGGSSKSNGSGGGGGGKKSSGGSGNSGYTGWKYEITTGGGHTFEGYSPEEAKKNAGIFASASNDPVYTSVKYENGKRVAVLGTRSDEYATGGLNDYTGPAWLDGTPQKPEYILNAEQTEEMFGIINSKTVSSLIDTMRTATQAMLAQLGMTSAASVGAFNSQTSNMQQEVHITAEFPDAIYHDEIIEAFETLTNKAAQYANIKMY